MTTELTSLTERAATGDPSAFAELLVALHQDLRASLATVATHQPMIDTAEREVWSMLRRELLVGVPDGPITLFIHQIAAAVASRLLQSMQNSSRSNGDNLQELMATDGLQRLQAPGVLSNTFAKEVIARVPKLPEDDRALLQAIYVDHISLHDYATTHQQPLTTIASRCFKIRRDLLDHNTAADDEAHDNQLALLIGCHLDRSIIPTDVMNLQNRIDINPVDATVIAQQIRAHVVLVELLCPPSPATVRIIAGELTKSNKLLTRTDSSLIRAVDKANSKSTRIPFTGLPPPPPPPKPEISLTLIYIAAVALIMCGAIALFLAWENTKSSSNPNRSKPSSTTTPPSHPSQSNATP